MQRDRARERMERAKRQWELEHASDTCIDGNIIEKLILKFRVQNHSSFAYQLNHPYKFYLGLGNNSQDEKSTGDNNGTGSACNTLSSNKGTTNSGGGAVVTMNHINATASGSNAPGVSTSSDTFNLVLF